MPLNHHKTYPTYHILEMIDDIVDREIEKIKDFDGFDPSARDTIHGIWVLSRALRAEFISRSD